MKNSLLLLGLLSLAFGCSPRVQVDRNQMANFGQYRTYAWMDSDVKAGNNPLYYNQIATQNVETTVNQVLSRKGLQLASDNPDLLIGYHFFVEKKTQNVPYPMPYYGAFYGPYLGWGRWGYGGWGPGWWNWGGYGGNGGYYQQNYQAGTVVVDMVDTRTHQLIWRGSIENAVADPARITQLLPKEIQRITEQYPNRS